VLIRFDCAERLTSSAFCAQSFESAGKVQASMRKASKRPAEPQHKSGNQEHSEVLNPRRITRARKADTIKQVAAKYSNLTQKKISTTGLRAQKYGLCSLQFTGLMPSTIVEPKVDVRKLWSASGFLLSDPADVVYLAKMLEALYAQANPHLSKSIIGVLGSTGSLQQQLQHHCLCDLCLVECDLTAAGIEPLVELLPLIRNLNLSRNKIGPMGLVAIANGLYPHNNNSSSNNNNDNNKNVNSINNKNRLLSLNISNNRLIGLYVYRMQVMGECCLQGIEALFNMLANSCCCLEHLDLSGNHLGGM
jgi:hypothetical protein